MTGQRPTCFGLPSVYHQGSERCQSCTHSSRCDEQAYARLYGLAEVIDVSDSLVRFQGRNDDGLRSPVTRAVPKLTVNSDRVTKREKVRLAIPQDMEPALRNLSKRVEKKARSMLMLGSDRVVRFSLQRGNNPFSLDKESHFRIAADLLIKGGFTRDQLRKCLTEDLKWTDATARSYVSSTVSLFTALSFAKEDCDGKLRIVSKR